MENCSAHTLTNILGLKLATGGGEIDLTVAEGTTCFVRTSELKVATDRRISGVTTLFDKEDHIGDVSISMVQREMTFFLLPEPNKPATQ